MNLILATSKGFDKKNIHATKDITKRRLQHQ